jgi:hypothetical protein
MRLEALAIQVGLEGFTLTGMAFTLFDGKATWERAGTKTTADSRQQRMTTRHPRPLASSVTV